MPVEVLRDVLGIARAVYVAWKRNGQGPIEMEELRSIGEDLRDAYRLASRSKAGTNAHNAAWAKAERATIRLGDLLSNYETIKSLVGSESEKLGFTNKYQRQRFDPSVKVRERTKRG